MQSTLKINQIPSPDPAPRVVLRALKNHCPVCRSNSFVLAAPSSSYCLFTCKSCATWFDPISKDNLSSQYSESYYFSGPENQSGYANYMSDMATNRQTFVRRFKHAEKLLGRPGRLLDLGCALGESLVVSKERGWAEHLGVEVSDYCVQAGRERGLNIMHQRDFLKNAPRDYFDLVLMQDVLEHVENPIDELSTAYSALRPGGIIFVSTPNISSLSRKLLGRFWYHFKPGEHIIYFSPQSGMMALLTAGFTKVKAQPGISVMGVGAILQRLERYSSFFGVASRVSSHIGLGSITVPIAIGNIDMWGVKPLR